MKYYVQNTDNSGYSLSETAALTGQMGEEVTAKAADLDEKVYHLKGELPKGTIKADGSLVLKVYYDLNEYKLTFDAKGGESDQTEVTARYGDKIASPMPTRKGYVFEGWYTDEACENAFGQTMPDKRYDGLCKMGEAESQLYSPASARKNCQMQKKKNRVEIKKSIRTQINRLWKKIHISYMKRKSLRHIRKIK